MQRNANMLKILKKVRFCRFYWFLCKNAVPSLSPRTNFCPSGWICNTLNANRLNSAFYILCGKIIFLHRQVIMLPRNINNQHQYFHGNLKIVLLSQWIFLHIIYLSYIIGNIDIRGLYWSLFLCLSAP